MEVHKLCSGWSRKVFAEEIGKMLVRFRTREKSGSAGAARAASIHNYRHLPMLPVRLFLAARYGRFLLSPAGAAVRLTLKGAAMQRAFCTRLLLPLFFHPAATGVCGPSLGRTATDIAVARTLAGNSMGKRWRFERQRRKRAQCDERIGRKEYQSYGWVPASLHKGFTGSGRQGFLGRDIEQYRRRFDLYRLAFAGNSSCSRVTLL